MSNKENLENKETSEKSCLSKEDESGYDNVDNMQNGKNGVDDQSCEDNCENLDTKDANSDDSSIDEIGSLKSEIKSWEEKYIRVHSDFDNIKKRLERDKIQSIEYACKSFAKDLIAIVDSLEMAIKATDENSKGIKDGVELTLKQLLSILEKNGVVAIDCSLGFDPNVHEAVIKVKSEEVQSGSIVEVMQKGYKFKDLVIRAAMVSIAE